ncbi:MAG: NAD(P)H-dependent oxidoreductase [Cellvibrionales bacterium]|nr:NAD(P)H-dependent oxidoreductase [Cellvibrionales bacterium]
MPEKNVLLLFAHPAIEQSDANVELFNAAQSIDGIQCVDLYAEYPQHDIDVCIEQQRLRESDVIIFQFPLYWYSTPAILKDWMDLVLEHGFAYGKTGDALKDKTLLLAITAGGPEEAYCGEGFNHYSIRELLRPLEQTANFCRMAFSAPFVLFGTRTSLDDERLSAHILHWKRLLSAIKDNQIDLKASSHLPKLNAEVAKLMELEQ